MGLIMKEPAVPASSPNTHRIPIPPALDDTVTQPTIQMPIHVPAPTLLSSFRPPRKVSDNPKRRRTLGRSNHIFPVYERSPSPLGGHATYRTKEQRDLGHTREQRERLRQMAQDGMFKQDFIDDNYVWTCPVKTCRHIFRMKESESWTAEVKRSVTSAVRSWLYLCLAESCIDSYNPSRNGTSWRIKCGDAEMKPQVILLRRRLCGPIMRCTLLSMDST
jgi:hypothetical protein